MQFKRNLFIFSITVALMTLGQNVSAQLIPVLGSQRAGTAMFQFLKIGVGGRAVGMGESFVAVANDASALYWNPAGITQTKNNELFIAHVDWPVDIQHEFIGYTRRFGVNVIGLSAIALHTDDFEETTEFQPFGTGRFVTFGDISLGVTFARQMTDKFSLGATVKYVDETLDDIHARNVLIDFGTYYWTGFGSSRFAVSVVNFGTNVEPSGTVVQRDDIEVNAFQDFAPPTVFRVGFATEVVDNEQSRITTSIQLNHPNDNAENVNIGVEYGWKKMLSLRGGYKVNVEEESYAFGAGLRIPLNAFELHVDFSYSEFGRLGTANRFSANLKF